MKRLKWITNLISFGIKKKGQKNLTMEQRDFDMFEKCHEFEKNKRVTGAQWKWEFRTDKLCHVALRNEKFVDHLRTWSYR